MAHLTEEIKAVAEESFVWMLSTVNDDDSPRTIPVHYKKILPNDEMMIVNNYMKTTLNNLKARPDKVSLTFWDAGVVCHIEGSARIDSSGEIYQEGVKIVKDKRPNLSPKSVVVLKVTSTNIWYRPG